MDRMRRPVVATMAAVLVVGLAMTAWALTTEQQAACDDLLEVGTKQVNSSSTRIQSDGQRILDAHAVLCVEDGSTATTTVAAGGTAFTCTRILSMSQGGQIHQGVERLAADPDKWEAQIRGGRTLSYWTDPSFDGYTQPIISACTDRTEFRIIFLFDPARSNWPGDVHGAIAAIRYHNPDVDRIQLVLLLGAEGHVVCPSDMGERSTLRHNAHITRLGELDLAPYGDLVAWGPDLHVDDCSYFVDQIGHLTDPIGEDHVAAKVVASDE